MSETVLRWKGRIGSIKQATAVFAVLGAVFLVIAIIFLVEAVNNAGGPQTVTVAQLVNGEVKESRYVTVSGTAAYEGGYTQTSDGKTVAEYYFLVDSKSGAVVLVKSRTTVRVVESEEATVTGMTHALPSGLHQAVIEDMPDYRDAGLNIALGAYVGENDKPPSLPLALGATLILGGILFLCLVTLFFPSTVFAPRPVDVMAVPAAPGTDPGLKASGQFLQLQSVSPLQVGRRKRKFSNAFANLIPAEGSQLVVYIHHILHVKSYGITVRTVETHWGAFVDPSRVRSVEPGQLYAWRERPAVRLRYLDEKGKEQALIVSFNHAGAQGSFVELLRKTGFSIG
jgi:hypothetical protein